MPLNFDKNSFGYSKAPVEEVLDGSVNELNENMQDSSWRNKLNFDEEKFNGEGYDDQEEEEVTRRSFYKKWNRLMTV
ncbi:hypothetical protein RUM43_003148 [Polyplax serrata]|uniref:Uncharacterized protein n=1 Tax=Polyplax serrata TaxID=468196 RepID=A0AAN8S9C2_POLSC